MLTRRTLGLTILACLSIPVGSNWAAAASPDDAQSMVKQLSDDAIKLLTGKDLSADERDRRFAKLLTKGFDVPQMARFALGRYWREANQDQQTEYMRLFEAFVIGTYAQRFANYQGESLNVLGSQPEGSDTIVRTQIMRVNPPQPIKVDWRVSRTDQGLKIIDVIVEGVSLTTTQRSDFASVIQRNGGVNGLLDSLRAKTKDVHAKT